MRLSNFVKDPEDLQGLDGGAKVAPDEDGAKEEPAAKGDDKKMTDKEASKKYMVNKNPEFAELKGKQKVVKTYYKGPGCCVKLKREFKRMTCTMALEEMGIPEEAMELAEGSSGYAVPNKMKQ
jgi:hypothetical protein